MLGIFARLQDIARDLTSLELWVARDIPYPTKDGSLLCFQPQHVVKHLEGEGWMICRITTSCLQICVIVAHAPHMGKPNDERQAWWSGLSNAIHRRRGAETIQCVMTVDANAALGSLTFCGIGSAGAETENENGTELRQLCEAHSFA